LGHGNIIDYCERPFKDVEDMNKKIISNHNARVKPEDTVFFLGDFCFRNTSGGKKGEGTLTRAEEYLKQLNGKFVFISGNHDYNNGINSKIHSAVIEYGGQQIYLVHDPADYSQHFALNFVGHVHNSWECKKLIDDTILVNVGVDAWNFKPVSFEEISKRIKNL
jgi:calcineurin-like phosphoesterase family protein